MIRWTAEERDSITKTILGLLNEAQIPVSAEVVTRQHILRAQMMALPEDRWRAVLHQRDVQVFGDMLVPYVFSSDMEAVKRFHQEFGKPLFPELEKLRVQFESLSQQFAATVLDLEEAKRLLADNEHKLLELMTAPAPQTTATTALLSDDEDDWVNDGGANTEAEAEADAEDDEEEDDDLLGFGIPQQRFDRIKAKIAKTKPKLMIVMNHPSKTFTDLIAALAIDARWLPTTARERQAADMSVDRHVLHLVGAVPRNVTRAMKRGHGVLSFTSIIGGNSGAQLAVLKFLEELPE